MKAMLHRDAPPVTMGDPEPEHTPVWKIEGEGELGNVGEVLCADDDWTYRPKTSPRRRNLEIILPTEWATRVRH